MKPLHTSSQVTASDSRMVVRVMEISTPDGPVRRIVVEVNAEMDTTEARWLRDKLDLAITLAEGSPAVECVCGTVPGSYDGPLPECDVHGLPSAAYKAGYAMAQAEAEQMKALDRPAVSEDQPKPRVGALALAPDWDDKTNNVVIERVDANGCQVTNSQGQSWWVGMDRIEVLADSEQVTADPADRPEWTCTNCGTEGNPGPDDRCGCCGGHRWEFDSEQATR